MTAVPGWLRQGHAPDCSGDDRRRYRQIFSPPALAGEIANKGYVDGAAASAAANAAADKLDAGAYEADASLRIKAAAQIAPDGSIVWAHGVTSCTRTQTGLYRIYSQYANISSIGVIAYTHVSTNAMGWASARDKRTETTNGGYVVISTFFIPTGSVTDVAFTIIFLDGDTA